MWVPTHLLFQLLLISVLLPLCLTVRLTSSVCLLQEAVLLTRMSSDPRDFTREVLCPMSAGYGDLEDPTPWEVQEAVQRVKERERRWAVYGASML